jgi:predicted metal-dependent HD superfamily phosphohydrolase
MTNTTLEKFSLLCRRLGIEEPMARDVFVELNQRYGESHRAYHNLHHIDQMLGTFHAMSESDHAMETAIWFHDSVYDPKQSDNEEQSALLFLRLLGGEMPASMAERVRRLILATDPRAARSGRADESLLIDIDRAILAAGPEEYEAYRLAIRREYGHVGDAQFAAGRGAFLKDCLTRPIFTTPDFLACEEKARKNLQRELDALKLPR